MRVSSSSFGLHRETTSAQQELESCIFYSFGNASFRFPFSLFLFGLDFVYLVYFVVNRRNADKFAFAQSHASIWFLSGNRSPAKEG